MFFSIFSQRHSFHLVDQSPWPLVTALGAFMTTTGGVMWFHSYPNGFFTLVTGLIMTTTCMASWWVDVIRESTFEGHHTWEVESGLEMGIFLFVASEVMFFFAFFWAFFSASLAPTIEIGSCWPPKGIDVLSAWEVPLLNTLILLLSGVTVTWSHHAMIEESRGQAIMGLLLTVLLAIAFTALQGFEYVSAPFGISDGVYGTTFFMATGFHGFHVFIGTCMLSVCLIRLYAYHFNDEHHFGFEASAVYWHFVDVVWLFLFVFIYVWGGL